MASYTYGQLTVPVTGDTRQLASDIAGAATAAGNQAASNISSSMTAGLKAVGGLGAAVGKSVATGIAGATVAAAGFGVEAFKTAARVGEMDASLRALAKANGLSEAEMQKSVTAIRKQGIEAGTAQQLVAQFARNQLDLGKSTDLARVAQDAAVISGRNSTEVLADLVHGITTQNSQVLRNAGLNVQAGQAVDKYAKSIGKATKDLTDAERSQAVLNAVLESGKTVAGAYAEAMTEPGKVLRSFPRLIDDIKLSVGQGLVQAFGPIIIQFYDFAKALSAAVAPGGALAPIFEAIGVAVGKLVAPLTGMITSWAKWIENLRPEQIERVVEVIKRFGPAILAGAAALTALVAPGILSQIPVLGGMLTNLLGPAKLVAGGLGSVGKAAAVQLIPGLAGAVGPIGGVGAALGGLALPVTAVVAGLAALMIASSDFREAMIDLGKGVLDFLMPILKGLWEGTLKPLALALWEIVRAIGDALAPVIKELSKLLKPLGELFGQAAGGGAEGGGVSGLGAAITAVLPLITGLIKAIGFVLEVVVKVIVPIAEVAIKLLTWVNAAIAVVNPLKLLGQAVEFLIDQVSRLWKWIVGGSPGIIPAFELLSSVASAVASLLGGPIVAAFSGLVSVVSSATSAVTGAVREGWSQMTGIISGAMSQIQGVVSSGFSSMVSHAKSAGSAMIDGLKSGLSAAQSLGGWIGSNVTGPVTGFLKKGFGVSSPSTITIVIGDDLIAGLRQGLEKAKQLGGWISSNVTGPVVGWLKSGLGIGSPSSITITFGADVIEGLKQGLAKARELGNWVKDNVCGPILGTIKGFFGIGSASKLMMGIGEDMVAGLEQGLEGAQQIDLGHGPDITSPLAGRSPAGIGALGGAAGAVINVYPRASQSEQEIAAMVSRELAWATAGGVA
jgi:phage-related protein